MLRVKDHYKLFLNGLWKLPLQNKSIKDLHFDFQHESGTNTRLLLGDYQQWKVILLFHTKSFFLYANKALCYNYGILNVYMFPVAIKLFISSFTLSLWPFQHSLPCTHKTELMHLSSKNSSSRWEHKEQHNVVL